MNKEHLKMLRATKKIKVNLLELSMISIALGHFVPSIKADDKDGEALCKAYKKLHKRLSKECKR